MTAEEAAAKVSAAASALVPQFAAVDNITAVNLRRTLKAFSDVHIGVHHLSGSTGYGHADLGREAIDAVFARVLGAPAACVRAHFQSGTHAITCALFGCLRPGDELLSVAGHPYDTLEEVIGLRGSPGDGSLAEWGVTYRELALTPKGGLDWDALATAVRPATRVALLQRSCGYAPRPSLSLDDIRRAAALIKAQSPRAVVFVDNCYGELVEVGGWGELSFLPSAWPPLTSTLRIMCVYGLGDLSYVAQAHGTVRPGTIHFNNDVDRDRGPRNVYFCRYIHQTSFTSK